MCRPNQHPHNLPSEWPEAAASPRTGAPKTSKTGPSKPVSLQLYHTSKKLPPTESLPPSSPGETRSAPEPQTPTTSELAQRHSPPHQSSPQQPQAQQSARFTSADRKPQNSTKQRTKHRKRRVFCPNNAKRRLSAAAEQNKRIDGPKTSSKGKRLPTSRWRRN